MMAQTAVLDIAPPPDYWNTNFLEQSSCSVPIAKSNEVVEFDLNNLPETDEVLELLVNEWPAVKTWNIIALHYLARGREDTFLAILEKWLEEKMSREANPATMKDDEAFCMDLLANYYALKYNDEMDRDRKKDYFSKAQRLYTQVEKLFAYSQYHLVGRAFFCLFDPEKIDHAVTQFDFALTNSPADYLALQGRGILAFRKGDYKKALSCFKKLLTCHPNCAPDIRMAIGHCLFKLNRYDKAKLAYERTLQLQRDCVGAMVGIALILLNEGTPQSIQSAMQLVASVYKMDRTHPINLNLLADHFFYREDPDKAISLSAVAIQTSHSETLKAESAYLLGRSHHFKEEYDQAFQYYYQATQFAKSNFVLPWYGLGQMYIQRGEFPNAIQCFEKVLAVNKDSFETMKMLGLLYLHTGNKEKIVQARSYLKTVIDKCPEDVDALIKFAELHESTDKKLAKESYLRVIHIFHARGEEDRCPPEILNNIAVLCFHLGEYKEARDRLEEAKRRAITERPNNEIHYGSILVTMQFNEGRIHEAEKRLEEAHECYTNILKDHFNYVDCYLRFGCMARDRGNILQASDWFKEAGIRDPENADCHLLLGNLHMSKSEYGPAQKKFEKILGNPKTKKDTYSLLSLANIWLESLYQPADPEKKKRHAERAYQMFREVLRNDPTNVYAVNGMGAILAKQGQLEEAREMFSVVREATADMLDLWLNIGHSYCDQKQYIAGIKMYENAIKRFPEAALDPTIYLYLARAHYLNNDLAAARKTLQHGRRLAPQHQVLRFNLGIVMKRSAVNTLKDFRSSLDSVRGAIDDLQSAQKTFEALAEDGDKHYIDPARASKEANACKDYYDQSSHHVDRAKRFDEEMQQQRDAVEKARQQYQERLLVAQKQKEEEQLKREEELRRKREEALQKVASVRDKIIRSETAPEEKPTRKRGRKDRQLEDGFIDDGPPVGQGEGEPRRKRKRDDPERRQRKTERRKRREKQREAEGGPVQSSSEDEDERELTKKDLYDGKGRRYLSKAYISDSDSSSSNSDSDDEGGGERKRAKDSVPEDSDDAEPSAKAGKAALDSSEDEATTSKKPARTALDSDEDEEPAKQSGSSRKAVLQDDEDGMAAPEEEPALSKLRLNDSDSD